MRTAPKWEWAEREEAAFWEKAAHELVLLFTRLLPTALASQCFFHTLLLAGLQIKRVPLHFFNYVFLLHLTLEATKRIFEGFSLLKSNFCQTDYTPKLVQKDRIVIARLQDQVKRNVKNVGNTLKSMLHPARNYFVKTLTATPTEPVLVHRR